MPETVSTDQNSAVSMGLHAQKALTLTNLTQAQFLAVTTTATSLNILEAVSNVPKN